MSRLSQYSLEELQQEIENRKNDLVAEKLRRVYDAIQDLEDVAVSTRQEVTVNLGMNISLYFSLSDEDWTLA